MPSGSRRHRAKKIASAESQDPRKRDQETIRLIIQALDKDPVSHEMGIELSLWICHEGDLKNLPEEAYCAGRQAFPAQSGRCQGPSKRQGRLQDMPRPLNAWHGSLRSPVDTHVRSFVNLKPVLQLRARVWPILLGVNSDFDPEQYSLWREGKHRDSTVVSCDVQRSLWSFTEGIRNNMHLELATNNSFSDTFSGFLP